MAVINALDCNVVQTWTGAATCDAKMYVHKGGFLLPHGTKLTASEFATLQATLQAGMIDNDFRDRFLMLNLSKGVEDNSEETQSFTYPDGTSIVTREEVYKWAYEHAVGQCYQQNLRKVNEKQSQYDWLPFDSQNVIWGTLNTDNTVSGYSLAKIWARAPKAASYTDPSRFYVDIELADTTELADRAAFGKMSFNPLTVLQGVQGVNVVNVGSNNWTTGVFAVTSFTACGGINLVTEYGGELDATGAWLVTNHATGVAIPVTSVTQSTTGGVPTFTLDVDAADANYPTSGGSIDIRLNAVSALTALGVSYYEQMVTLNLTRP